MAIVGLIPARGGSKGIPDKNLREVGGASLLARAARAASESKLLSGCYLSTDSPQIAEAGRKAGLLVPFLRPAEIATDSTPMIDVIQQFLAWYEMDKGQLEAIVLLQPTSPFRTAKHIDEAISLWRNKKADSVVSVQEIPHHFHPDGAMRLDAAGELHRLNAEKSSPLRRQDKPKVYSRNGPAILVTGVPTLKKGELYGARNFGYLMKALDSIDIDDKDDLMLAEAIAKTRAGDSN